MKEHLDMIYNKETAPILIVEPASPVLEENLHILQNDSFLIRKLPATEIPDAVHDLPEGAVCIANIEHDEVRHTLAQVLGSHPELSLISCISKNPGQFFPFLQAHNCGTLILEKDIPELLNNTVHAFFVKEPKQVFSIPSILKGRFTLDERRFERRRKRPPDPKEPGANQEQRSNGDRRQNKIIPLGSILEFGDDAMVIRTKILDTVHRFFIEHDLNFLMEEPTVQIGIDELVSNILKHAYDADEQKLAHLVLIQDKRNEKLLLLIQDYKGNFSKETFLEEMVRNYNNTIRSASELGTQGTGFRFVRQCSDLLIVTIIHGLMTKFILVYDIDRIREQQYPEPGEKSMLVFEFPGNEQYTTDSDLPQA